MHGVNDGSLGGGGGGRCQKKNKRNLMFKELRSLDNRELEILEQLRARARAQLK